MSRNALDMGLKSKFPDMQGTLKARMQEVAKQQKLTPDLAQWAHQIRFGSNDAAHEEELISKEDAKKLCNFTKLVFQDSISWIARVLGCNSIGKQQGSDTCGNG